MSEQPLTARQLVRILVVLAAIAFVIVWVHNVQQADRQVRQAEQRADCILTHVCP